MRAEIGIVPVIIGPCNHLADVDACTSRTRSEIAVGEKKGFKGELSTILCRGYCSWSEHCCLSISCAHPKIPSQIPFIVGKRHYNQKYNVFSPLRRGCHRSFFVSLPLLVHVNAVVKTNLMLASNQSRFNQIRNRKVSRPPIPPLFVLGGFFAQEKRRTGKVPYVGQFCCRRLEEMKR